MSRAAAPPPVCDGPGCGKQKQEANRWWQAAVDLRTPDLIENPGARRNAFRLAIFDLAESRENMEWAGWTWYDFCGQTCALKWVSEQMGKVTS
jgi:hypothetical protein